MCWALFARKKVKPMKNIDVIIIGAGAAGMMCGIEAGARGRSVLILDKSNKAGKKSLCQAAGGVISRICTQALQNSYPIILIFVNQPSVGIRNGILSR